MSGPDRFEDETGRGERGGPGGAPRRTGAGSAAPLGSGEYAGAGLQLAVTIVAFMFLGIWLDRTLGTTPWLVIVCVFAGAAAGFYSIYRKLTTAQRRADAERRARRERSREGRGTGGGSGTAP